MAEEWFYVDENSEQVGPLPIPALKELFAKKTVDEDTFFWRDGQAEWLPLGDIIALKAKLKPPPTPKLPPPPPAAVPKAPAPPPKAKPVPAPPPKTVIGAPSPAPAPAPAPVPAKPSHRGSATAIGIKRVGAPPTGPAALKPSAPKSLAPPPRKRNSQINKLADNQVPKPLNSKPALPAAPKPVPGTSRIMQRRASRSGKNMARESQQGHWVEKVTVDGALYYSNPSTEAVSWDKPDCLKTDEELQTEAGEWIWVSDPKEVWVPARLLNENGGEISVQLQSGMRKTISANDPSEPRWPLLLSSLRHIEDDLVMMDSLNQGLLMHALKQRYQEDKIYTWVGANKSVLVSVNPFKSLPIYTVNCMEIHSKPSPNKPPPPHTFAIANHSYMRMKLDHQNQAILISGESGAGKTECTKQCLSFLAEVAGSESNVEQKILNANPVLEAFGNAKTLRNNNSSRFGRWMEVSFDARGGICGCKIENYLLEKARVVRQTSGERNYHIFYQLCTSKKWGQLYGVTRPADFRYLSESGCETVTGIDDEADFNDVTLALTQLGFAEDEIDQMFGITAAVLYIGNIKFKSDGGEGSKLDDSSFEVQNVDNASTLLGCDAKRLALAFCERNIEVRGEKNRILNKPEEAREACDSFAKAVYNNLFDWIVKKINQCVQGQKGLFIGILDIFGFEIFKQNNFEQLCINFTNEKLQQHFNTNTFKEEENVYVSEGIEFDKVPFIDNQPVLDLIEKKPFGLLVLLDEEVRLPKGSDSKWHDKCDKNHENHECWLSDKNAKMRMEAANFTVRHYAGDVEYNSNGFYDKNKDALFRDLYDLMSESSMNLSRQCFPPKDKNPRKLTSISGQFRMQLNQLMQVVNTCQPRYIRCVKPNDAKRPNNFEMVMSIEQLTYAGVFEAVKIRKSGFPFRLLHRSFAARYRCLAKGRATFGHVREGDDRSLCVEIMKCLPQDFSRVRIGNTMILYRAEEHRILELLRNLALELIIPSAQRGSRRGIGWRYLRKVREVKRVCNEALRVANDVRMLDSAIKNVNETLGPMRILFPANPPELEKCKQQRHKLQERVEITEIMRGLVSRNAEEVYQELGCVIIRANKIVDIPGTADDMAIEEKCREMLKSCAGPRLDPLAEEALWLLKREAMVDVVGQADEVGYTSADIEEIKEKLALGEEAFVKLQLKRANEMNDPERVINREIRLKELFLDSMGALFTLDKLGLLQDPEEWASMKLFSFARNTELIAETFLVHTEKPIHAPLTKLEPGPTSKSACKMFRNVMGYMGDRKYNYPDTLAQELISSGLDGEEDLRAELYVQVMKQLIDNPSIASETRGWELLSLFLSSFPPPSSIENHLAMFLREHCESDAKREKFVTSMHVIIYGGERTNKMSLSEIPNCVASFHNRPVTRRYQKNDYISSRTMMANAKMEQGGVAASGGGSLAHQGGGGQSGGGKPAPPPDRAVAVAVAVAGGGGGGGGGGMPPLPPPPPPSAEPTGTCLFDYNPAEEQEGMIKLRKGSVVEIINKEDSEWWLVKSRKGSKPEGWVPASYLQSN